MTRNVTDAAVVLGAMTGVDRHDPATGPAGRSRLPRLHEVPRQATRSAAPGSASGARAPTIPRSARRSTQIINDNDRGARGRGRDRHRQHADPDRARLRPGVHRAAVRVQGRHRGLPRDVHAARVPEDAPGPDRLQQRASGAGRALELGDLRARPGDRRPGRSGVHRGP